MPLFRVSLSASAFHEIEAPTEDEAVQCALDITDIDGAMWDLDDVTLIQSDDDEEDEL